MNEFLLTPNKFLDSFTNELYPESGNEDTWKEMIMKSDYHFSCRKLDWSDGKYYYIVDGNTKFIGINETKNIKGTYGIEKESQQFLQAAIYFLKDRLAHPNERELTKFLTLTTQKWCKILYLRDSDGNLKCQPFWEWLSLTWTEASKEYTPSTAYKYGEFSPAILVAWYQQFANDADYFSITEDGLDVRELTQTLVEKCL